MLEFIKNDMKADLADLISIGNVGELQSLALSILTKMYNRGSSIEFFVADDERDMQACRDLRRWRNIFYGLLYGKSRYVMWNADATPEFGNEGINFEGGYIRFHSYDSLNEIVDEIRGNEEDDEEDDEELDDDDQ